MTFAASCHGPPGLCGSNQTSNTSLPLLREKLLDAIEPVGPELLDLRGPARDVAQRRGVELERVFAAVARAPDQAGGLEHLDVLRDCVERHVETLGDVGDVRGAAGQPLDDGAPRRIGERGPDRFVRCDVNGRHNRRLETALRHRIAALGDRRARRRNAAVHGR